MLPLFPNRVTANVVALQDHVFTYYSGHTEEEIQPVVAKMLRYLASPSVEHDAFFRKYAHKKFGKGKRYYVACLSLMVMNLSKKYVLIESVYVQRLSSVDTGPRRLTSPSTRPPSPPPSPKHRPHPLGPSHDREKNLHPPPLPIHVQDTHICFGWRPGSERK